MMFLVYFLLFFVLSCSTSASDCLERLVSEMTYYVLSGTSNSTHSLTHDTCRLLSLRAIFVLFLSLKIWGSGPSPSQNFG